MGLVHDRDKQLSELRLTRSQRRALLLSPTGLSTLVQRHVWRALDGVPKEGAATLEGVQRDADPAGTTVTDHAASELAIDRASRKDLARAIAATFREAFMPPFAQLVAILFNNSDPQERTDVLNELAPSVLPSAASRIAGGALARAFASGTEGAIRFDQAGWFSPTDVRAIAAHAARHDPLLIDRLGVFYSDRPALVKTLPLATVVAVASHLRSHE